MPLPHEDSGARSTRRRWVKDQLLVYGDALPRSCGAAFPLLVGVAVADQAGTSRCTRSLSAFLASMRAFVACA